MRYQIITSVSLLILGSGAAFAQQAAPSATDPANVQQLNQDIREQEGNLKRNEWDAGHDQRDIDRDEGLRNVDRAREQRDLRDGDLRGARVWSRQANDENHEIAHDRRDLAHSRRDIHTDKERLAKDFHARRADGGAHK
jgi:hypothetical protein